MAPKGNKANKGKITIDTIYKKASKKGTAGNDIDIYFYQVPENVDKVVYETLVYWFEEQHTTITHIKVLFQNKDLFPYFSDLDANIVFEQDKVNLYVFPELAKLNKEKK